MFYVKMLSNLSEFEDNLEPWEKYRMPYIKEMVLQYDPICYVMLITICTSYPLHSKL